MSRNFREGTRYGRTGENTREKLILAGIQKINGHGAAEPSIRRKLPLVRSMILGSVFLFDAGDLEYSEEAPERIRCNVDRESDLQ